MRELDFGLALGGGGAKGLSHIPFLMALDDMGVRPKVIAGCSIGAIVAGLYAGGIPARELVKLISGARALDIAVDSMTDWKKGQLRSDHGLLGRFLRQKLPVKSFAELSIPCIFVAADYDTREPVFISDGDLTSAICGSAALPGLFKPVLRGGRLLVDGGCVNPVPFDAILGKARYCAGIDVSGMRDVVPRHSRRPTRRASLFNAYQIMQSTILREKLKQTPIDFLATPQLKNVKVLHFHMAEAIIEAARDDVARFKRWIESIA
jgi:NTE family protein